MIEITKHVELDAGHRVPDHTSKCRSPHGHRYKVEAAVVGPVLEAGPETGMVLDYGHLKALLVEHVHDPWDHAFLVHAGDNLMRAALVPEWKVAVLDLVPTAENLALLAAEALAPAVARWHPGLRLVRLTVWETPTCSASWREDGA